jgi:hypothetical protein
MMEANMDAAGVAFRQNLGLLQMVGSRLLGSEARLLRTQGVSYFITNERGINTPR